MVTELKKIQGLIAGEGILPVNAAKCASEQDYDVICISFDSKNYHDLKKYCKKVYKFAPGEVEKILITLNEEQVEQLTFIGKVSKTILFSPRNLKLDKRAFNLIKTAKKLNDDALMLLMIKELEKENIEALDQTLFIKNLLVKKGVLGEHQPTPEQLEDIEFGFGLAKEMGRLDIGQSVVVQNKMILAVEAIEGTDRAIERGCKLGNKNAVVVKVSKPNQDKRFDIPAIGMRTIKAMKRYGGTVIALEADETFIIDREKMIDYADKNEIVVIAV